MTLSPSPSQRLRDSLLRWLAPLLFLTLLAVLLAGCSGPAGASANLSGRVLAVGSTALQPLVTKAAARFEQSQPHVHVQVQGGGSSFGLQAVTSHKSDIGDSDIYADPAQYPDPNLTDHLVCVIPFAMVVNPDVTVSSLSRDQIIKIFSTGEITNWQQVGGPNLPIVPIVRPITSGTRATFRKYILGGRDEKGNLLRTDSSQTVLSTVAHTPGAIGYLALSVRDATVNVVAIDGVAPTPANIEAGRYAFWGYEHMYTLDVSSGGPINTFLDFMLTPEIQQLAQSLGYIPIADMKLSAISSPTSQIGPLQPSALASSASSAASSTRRRGSI